MSKKEVSILNKRSKSEKIVYAIVFAIFCLYAISLILPFLFVISNSLKDGWEYFYDSLDRTTFHLPDKAHFENYLLAFTEMQAPNSKGESIFLPQMFFNSIWYTVFYVGAGVFASSITAYIVAKYRFAGRNIIDGIAIFSMTIPVIGTTAAMLKLQSILRIDNMPLLPLLIGFSGFGFNFLVLRGFFANLPWSYAESVFVDGGGHLTVFFKIMLPQAIPCILTLFLMSFITTWNDYQTLLLYMPDYPTLASGLYRIELSILRDTEKYPMYYAGLMISMVPVVVLFAVFSDTIMSNFTVGGLKG